jgi:hypothetical protein
LYSLPVRIAVLGARGAPSRYCQPAKGETRQASGYQGRALGWFGSLSEEHFTLQHSETMDDGRTDWIRKVTIALGIGPEHERMPV